MKKYVFGALLVFVSLPLVALSATFDDLSPEEQRIFNKGEIPLGRYIPGGIVGTLAGFGIGHAIQGNYADSGWKFTVGQSVGYGLLLGGMISGISRNKDANDDYQFETIDWTLIGAGLGIYMGFHIWEIVDVWTWIPEHNRKYRSITARLGKAETKPTFFAYPALAANNGYGLGLGLKF